MSTTIKDFVIEREIKYLMHFTRASNLDSILQRGLVPRDTLTSEGYEHFNDSLRLDHTDSVCLSIGFPNYKMFYGIQKDNPGVDWVILAISPEVLWRLPSAFCCANAASSSVVAVPLEERKKLAALKAMYSDWGDKSRVALDIPNNYPTNPQAEVLMLEGVPRSYIFGVIVLNNAKKEELQSIYRDLQVIVNANYFRYRKDYAHWK